MAMVTCRRLAAVCRRVSARALVCWSTRSLLGLACAISACAAAPTTATASAHDTAATRAYLRASEAYVHSGQQLMGKMIDAIDAYEGEVAAQCPGALTYAPRDASFAQLAEELARALWYAQAAPERLPLLRSARAIGHLRWSDRRITRLVRSEAAEERADAALVLPDVCDAIKAWQASAYATLPTSVTAFLRHTEAIVAGALVGSSEEPREILILHLLTRYEGPAERRIGRDVKRHYAQIGKRLGTAAEAASRKLAAAMGVSEL